MLCGRRFLALHLLLFLLRRAPEDVPWGVVDEPGKSLEFLIDKGTLGPSRCGWHGRRSTNAKKRRLSGRHRLAAGFADEVLPQALGGLFTAVEDKAKGLDDRLSGALLTANDAGHRLRSRSRARLLVLFLALHKDPYVAAVEGRR